MNQVAQTIEQDPVETSTLEVLLPEAQQVPAVAQQSKEIAPAVAGNALMDFMLATKDMDENRIKLFQEMYHKEQDREARKTFFAELPQMKAELPMVVKRGYNDQTSSHYATMDDVVQAAAPSMGKYGFSIFFQTEDEDDNGITVRGTLAHRSGHTETTVLTMPFDKTGIAGKVNKTDLHAKKSTLTYIEGTILKMLLGYAAGKDTDGNDNRKRQEENPFISADEAVELDLAITEAGIDRAQFFEWAKTEDAEGNPVQDARRIYKKHLAQCKRAVADRKKEAAKKGGAK